MTNAGHSSHQLSPQTTRENTHGFNSVGDQSGGLRETSVEAIHACLVSDRPRHLSFPAQHMVFEQAPHDEADAITPDNRGHVSARHTEHNGHSCPRTVQIFHVCTSAYFRWITAWHFFSTRSSGYTLYGLSTSQVVSPRPKALAGAGTLVSHDLERHRPLTVCRMPCPGG